MLSGPLPSVRQRARQHQHTEVLRIARVDLRSHRPNLSVWKSWASCSCVLRAAVGGSDERFKALRAKKWGQSSDCASAQACGELVGDREQSRQLWTLIRIWRAEMASFWTLPGREATVPMFASISGVSDGIVAIASRRAGGRAHEPRTSSVL